MKNLKISKVFVLVMLMLSPLLTENLYANPNSSNKPQTREEQYEPQIGFLSSYTIPYLDNGSCKPFLIQSYLTYGKVNNGYISVDRVDKEIILKKKTRNTKKLSFIVDDQRGEKFKIVSKYSQGTCLSVGNGEMKDNPKMDEFKQGTSVTLKYDTYRSGFQRFKLKHLGNGIFVIFANETNLVLTAATVEGKDDTFVQLTPFEESPTQSQAWFLVDPKTNEKIVPRAHGYY